MNPLIRPAVEGDLAALSALAFDAKSHWGYAPDVMHGWRDQLQISATDLAAMRIGVAVADGTICGFYALLPGEQAWALEHLWVAPRSMRRGIGRALLAHALDVAFGRGASVVTADADPHAEAIYCANGAVRVGVVAAPIAGDAARVRPQLVFTAARGAPQ